MRAKTIEQSLNYSQVVTSSLFGVVRPCYIHCDCRSNSILIWFRRSEQELHPVHPLSAWPKKSSKTVSKFNVPPSQAAP